MQDVQATLPVGTLIRERYLVKSLVGKGSSGAVYLVEDQRVKRARRNMFALKEIIGLSQQERYSFTFDSVPLRQIHHQSLPRIYHVFNDDRRSRICIVMDYVDGPDLETLCQHQPQQRFSWSVVAQILAPIVDALSYLHRQEPPIVHGDVKPVNILLIQLEERFMLVDIGVARERSPDLSDLSGYTAPEQDGKAVDARADVYGLAATMYTLLTGVVPTNAHVRLAQFERAQVDPLQPANAVVPAIPLHVSRAIHRAMSIYADERFPSVEEFWQALQTPPKELKPVVDELALPTTTSAPTAAAQAPVLAAVQTPVFSKRSRDNISPSSFLQGHLVPLLLVVLFLLVGAGAGIWSIVQSQQATTAIAKPTGTTPHALTTPVLSSTAPIVTPTSSPGNYPSIVGSYTGTLVDVPAKMSAPMILQGIHQLGGTINGFLTLGAPLKLSGPFSGTIDFSKHFQFTVIDAAGHPLLFIEGAIQTATSLSGDFWRCASAPTQAGKCSRASDSYGIWNALLVTSTG